MANHDSQLAEARECLQTLVEISDMLHTGLEPDILSVCIRLLQCGVNPEALAVVVSEIKSSVDERKNSEESEAVGKDFVI